MAGTMMRMMGMMRRARTNTATNHTCSRSPNLLHILRPVWFLAYRMGETVGAVNQVIDSISNGIDGASAVFGTGLDDLEDAWCKLVPSPTCASRPLQEGLQERKMSSTAPLSNTMEMIEGHKHLNDFVIEIDFLRR